MTRERGSSVVSVVAASLGLVSIVAIGIFLIPEYDGWVIVGLMAAAGLCLVIAAHPFVGLVLLVGMIPLESAFLGLGGGVLTVTRLLGIYVTVAWLMQLAAKRRRLKWPASAKWMIVFMAWAGASYLWAAYQEITLGSIQTAVQLLLLAFLVIDQVNSPSRLELTLKALFLGCLASTVLGLLGIGVRSEYPLLTLQNQGAKEFSSYVGIVFLMGMILSVFATGRLKITARAALVVSILPLVSSGERGVILALSLSCVALAVVARRKLIALSTIVLLLAAMYFLPRVLAQAGLVNAAIIQRWTIASIVETGGTGRVKIWTASLGTIYDHVWIGVGLGNFGVNPAVGNAHNDWLGIAGELGFVGLLIFTAMLGRTGKRLVEIVRNELDSRKRLLAMMVLALFIYSLSIGLTSVYMWRKIYWLILAWAMLVPDLLLEHEQAGEEHAMGRVPISAMDCLAPSQKQLRQ